MLSGTPWTPRGSELVNSWSIILQVLGQILWVDEQAHLAGPGIDLGVYIEAPF